jgi:hypothetical protein
MVSPEALENYSLLGFGRGRAAVKTIDLRLAPYRLRYAVLEI